MMTTMAALLGGVPLMLSHGTGSEMRQPLGYTMVGGLLVSQALTLFTTPVIYIYLDRLSNWVSGGQEGQAAGAEGGARASVGASASRGVMWVPGLASRRRPERSKSWRSDTRVAACLGRWRDIDNSSVGRGDLSLD